MSGRASGNRGEAEVARYLRKQGYTLLASQWRCRFGELDLVAKDRKGMLCVVEVKRRSNLCCGLPRECVDNRKQEKLRMAASAYMSHYELEVPVRFDVAEVYADGAGNILKIGYLENEF